MGWLDYQKKHEVAPGLYRIPERAAYPLPADDNWMRVAPGTDAAIWRPWSRETGEL